MKVLHIYKAYPPVLGGVEKSLQLLSERQAKRGLEVTVLVCTDGTPSVTVENDVRVIRTRSWGTISSAPFSPELFHQVRQYGQARQGGVDITHLHAPYPMGELAHLFGGRSRATVITYHSDIVRQRWLGRLYRPLQRQVLGQADCIVTSSVQLLRGSPQLKPVADKCRMIPLGIDPAPFQNVDTECLAHFRSQLQPPIILFVGRLRYYKGVDVLIEAMASVAGSLVIIGAGPMETRWRRRAQQSPAQARIHFQGEISDQQLAAYYALADVFVLPSTQRAETFGLVQLEAMAAGLPVVSTEVGTGTSFVNLDGQTGYIVPPRDPRGLAIALNALLSSAIRRKSMGEAGQQRVAQLFHIDSTVEQTLSLYQELLSGHTR